MPSSQRARISFRSNSCMPPQGMAILGLVLAVGKGRMVEWQLPRYDTIHRLLTNPIYAGAYAYGRTGSKVRMEAGRKLIARGVRRAQQEWEVLIRDHHEAYI